MTENRPRPRVPHTCPRCGRVRHLEKATAARTTHCRRCHCQQIAPLGFQAAAAKCGQDFALRAAARWRIEQPSALERQVEAALRQIPGLTWEREVAVERPGALPYFVDFVVCVQGRSLALEVEGAYAHRQDTPERRSRRMQHLLTRFDAVIILTEADLCQHRHALPDYLTTRFE